MVAAEPMSVRRRDGLREAEGSGEARQVGRGGATRAKTAAFCALLALAHTLGCGGGVRSGEPPRLVRTEPSFAGPLVLGERSYFEAQGLDVLVFSNSYNGLFDDSKMSGIELIHHGVRTATNGDVRLDATPEQWDAIPQFVRRVADPGSNTVEAFSRYATPGFDFSVRAHGSGAVLDIGVHSQQPLPQEMVGKVGFNLEFLPAAYFEKAYLMDGRPGLFPSYPTGLKEQPGTAPFLLASGHTLVLAPEDPERTVVIVSKQAELELYDGRGKAQNGWFVVRSRLPEGQSGTLLEWSLSAGTAGGWIRPPVIAHSQAGYHPAQRKVAVVELDRRSVAVGKSTLYRVEADGSREIALQAEPARWGRYARYDYAQLDFSQVRQEGLYVLEHGGVVTAPFPIASDVYERAWHSTLDIYLPVQMDHVLVNEAYRVWHGASHLDDAVQAPVSHEHFDLYAQGPTTDTQYSPGEHIEGLNVGGWYDAGDYDIRTQTQYHTVLQLIHAWEAFGIDRDTTLVDRAAKYVDLHVPDGKPDVLQQIEHGTLALLAQHRAVGHAIPGIIVPTLSQYTHLGDGLTMTDNLVHDPGKGQNDSDGLTSGKPDDRWAFTSRSSALNYGSSAALAAASRALVQYAPALSRECLETAEKVWAEEATHPPYTFRHGNTTGGPLEAEQLAAPTEQAIATKKSVYTQWLQGAGAELQEHFRFHAASAVRLLPLMDGAFRERVKQLAADYARQLAERDRQNPFGVEITEGGWAGNGRVVGDAITAYWLHKAFPKLIDRERVLTGLSYLFGTHPGSDISFVSNVGARSKKVAYGMNRADYSFIAGGVVPGVLMVKPDFPENKEDWPFLWGENEYVVALAASYLFLVNAALDLLEDPSAL
jgi:hypothetical protein